MQWHHPAPATPHQHTNKQTNTRTSRQTHEQADKHTSGPATVRLLGYLCNSSNFNQVLFAHVVNLLNRAVQSMFRFYVDHEALQKSMMINRCCRDS